MEKKNVIRPSAVLKIGCIKFWKLYLSLFETVSNNHKEGKAQLR